MRRIALVITLIAVMPLLLGAGGGNPSPFPTKIAGPTFNASVVMDPHEAASGTTTAKQASIRIYSNGNTAGAMFHIPASGFPLDHGCDLSFTDQRFRFVTLISWIPEDVLNALFNDLGTGRNPSFEPAITKILNDTCTPDPANPTTVESSPGTPSIPGILSFQAVIRFQVPK
jgi:hypothetical protein